MEAGGRAGLSRHRRARACRICRWRRGSGWAGAAAISSSTAPRGCGASMWSRFPAPARSTSSAISTRRSCWWSRAAARPRSGRKARPSGTSSNGRRARCSRSRSTPSIASSMPASAPALLLCGTTAPNVMNLIDNPDFIFNCPYTFTERFSGADDFFKPSDDIEPDPMRGLAMRRTNLIPDIVNTELPLDNRRSPGYRRVEPSMAGNRFYLWIGQHETGRYSKAHKHASAAVLICVKGKGYTYTWPEIARHHALEGRQGRQDPAPGLRAGRHGLGRADERRLVPPAFRHRQGGAAHHRLARPQQSARPQGRPPRRAADGFRRHRSQQGRQRHSLSPGRPGDPPGVQRGPQGAKASPAG